MKNILIIQGHPNSESYCKALADAYKKGAEEAGNSVELIQIGELDFDPNLKYGYQKRMELEPDLLESWEKIKKADHLVWVHPVWWGGLPAQLKGFIDRLFLPGMAFQYRENSVWWDKLLIGKTAHIITTMDQPSWYYRWMYGRPSVNQLKKTVLEFCGIIPVKVTYVCPVKKSSTEFRTNWLDKVEQMGKALK